MLVVPLWSFVDTLRMVKKKKKGLLPNVLIPS